VIFDYRLKILSTFSSLLFLPVVFFAACRQDLPVISIDDYVPSIEEVYSNDWRYITVILGDKPIMINSNVAPPGNVSLTSSATQGRAMTTGAARLAFDYFEAVFCYTNPDGSERVARTSWQIGKEDGKEEEDGERKDDKGAVIFNVYRTPGGIDYSAAKAEKGKGAALLFAGRKSTHTLMGVGRVYAVDDVPGAPVTDQSSHVTFELSAINGSAGKYDDPVKKNKIYIDSFLTGNDGGEPSVNGTELIKALIRQNPFPLYFLPSGRPGVKAQYKFSFDNRDWSYYRDGIIVAEPNETEDEYSAMTREVRYPGGNGKYWWPEYKIDVTTKVNMTNNVTADQPVDNTVKFSFDTSNTKNVKKEDNGIFTLVFRVPLYAVTKSDGGERWFLEPGYYTYRYNIDNGTDSAGGGVFMGVDAPREFEVNAVRR